MEYIKIPYSLFKSMVLESKEKDIQIFETEADLRVINERLERSEEAYDKLEEELDAQRN
ncbi:hypothetical protein [Salinicoccus halodurans]|uniref:Uncharacterized protein n=1 Tax=Salinicoccus halodurans TaxID=407035 RepID=A0AA94HIF5_9STAP|nr:hypothetical protein [Salinicoccus halodurans]SFK95381.1 hypothetical protein SAMN05216235_2739 [Salinicoccus halodurans]